MADRKKTAATTSSGRPQTNASSSKSVPVEALVARRLGDMCNYLGIGENESHLFWIAEMALVAKLPPYWKEYKDKEGHVSSFPVHAGVDFRPHIGAASTAMETAAAQGLVHSLVQCVTPDQPNSLPKHLFLR
jgi:hypothetical protein